MSFVTYPERVVTIGKKGKSIMPDGTIGRFKVIDEIVCPASNEPDTKLLYLQKVQHESGELELRFCYYIIGKVGRMKDKWTFGQFAPFIQLEDFQMIVIQAKSKGWI